jgi:hypothetical protein
MTLAEKINRLVGKRREIPGGKKGIHLAFKALKQFIDIAVVRV